MRSILAREHGHLEAICDALIASLAGRCEDDITVILARIPACRAASRRGRPGPLSRPVRGTLYHPCITGPGARSGLATPPPGWFRGVQE